MSYGVSAFLVSARRLTSIPGSRNRRKFARVLAATREQIADYDDQLLDRENPEDISHGQALREIFDGTYTRPEYYSRYGWALESLCTYLGTFLDNGPFCPVGAGWEETLDRQLKKHRIPLRFRDLIYRPPISLPKWNDWPCVGHWAPAEIRKAAPLLLGVVPTVKDVWVREALTTVHQWFTLAVKRQDGMIVGFYG
jgi:hypothetical protein